MAQKKWDRREGGKTGPPCSTLCPTYMRSILAGKHSAILLVYKIFCHLSKTLFEMVPLPTQ